MRRESAIRGIGAVHIKITVLKAAFALVEHIEGFRLVLFQSGNGSLEHYERAFQSRKEFGGNNNRGVMEEVMSLAQYGTEEEAKATIAYRATNHGGKSWRERTRTARQLWPICAPHRRPTSAPTRSPRPRARPPREGEVRRAQAAWGVAPRGRRLGETPPSGEPQDRQAHEPTQDRSRPRRGWSSQ